MVQKYSLLFVLLACIRLSNSFYRSHSIIPTKQKYGLSGTSKCTSICMVNTEDLFIPLKYDAALIEKFYSKRPILVWERLVEIGSPILGWWLVKQYDKYREPFRSAQENEYYLNRRAEDLKDAIVQGKSVTAIKSGQALALRPDIVKSPEYIRELTKLQDEVGTFKNEIAFQIIRDELGSDPYDIYEFIPETPIASASIGQVYKAKLKSSNMTIALKVQRPDALASAALDMYILRKIAAYIKKTKKLRTDLVGIADQFGSQLFSELNYIEEANNCNRFKELYGNIPGIYVPSAYTNLTSQRVLTMEFVEGVKGPWAIGGERMLTVGLQCSVMQLLDSGFFHSDPHRGNLLQTPDGKLAYLDFGMMADVPSQQRYALIGTVLGLVNKDIPLVIDNLKVLKFLPPESDSTTIVKALNEAIIGSTQGGEGSSMNFTQLNQNLNNVASTGVFPVQLPPFYSLIIRTLTILEGLALAVDKDFRLVRGAYPFIAKQLLTSTSIELKELLEAILINRNTGKIKWDKLEQFLSIASNADLATQGDFNALKRAQDRSDLIKTYTNTQIDSNFTADATVQIVDFLISNNGKFLREPLLNEIVESLDNLGLTAATVISVMSNNIIPPPSEKPNRETMQQLVDLIRILSDIIRNSLQKASGNTVGPITSTINTNPLLSELNTLPGISVFLSVLDQVSTIIIRQIQALESGTSLPSQPLDPKIQALTRGISILLIQVLSRLAERTTRRTMKSIVNPENIKSLLPNLARLFDFQIPTF